MKVLVCTSFCLHSFALLQILIFLYLPCLGFKDSNPDLKEQYIVKSVRSHP